MARRLMIYPIVAFAGTVALAHSAAAACSPGYHKVKIQGNWVCALDVPNLSLTAKTTPQPGPIRTTPLWGVRSR